MPEAKTSVSSIDIAHPKDAQAQKWEREMSDKTPEQLIGEMISKGARVLNYISTRKEGWKPRISIQERKMVLFTELGIGPIFGAKALEAGLRFRKPAESKMFNQENLVMVPYPRFEEKTGKFNPGGSLILLFTNKQIADLNRLLS